MKLLDFENFKDFPPIFKDYITQKDSIRPFYTEFPTLEAFKNNINCRENFPKDRRKIVVETLKKQYKNIKNAPNRSIELLENPKTFTVTTGHQLNIYTGPLYVIYKIITTINLAKELAKKYPENNFIPVYWMASEDHDFQEINHFRVFGKKYVWEKEARGAVGRLDTLGLENLLTEKVPFFEEAYQNSATLAEAVVKYMNHLFGNEGLICLDADCKELKHFFIKTIQEDILESKFQPIVTKTTEILQKLGYKSIISPREINFFYLDKNLRERIVRNESKFEVLGTEISFSKEEIQDEIQENPEKFSPNVILRPLYQETILPNLAYIGGPSEVAYWLQLKGIFEISDVPFPLIIPRNFATIIPKSTAQTLEKLGIKAWELNQEENSLKKQFLDTQKNINLSLAQETESLKKILQIIAEKATIIDKTLAPSVQGEAKKIEQIILGIEKKMQKAEEKKQETQINQLINQKNKLFPNQNWQEREENFLTFYLNYPNFIDILKKNFSPLKFKIIFLPIE